METNTPPQAAGSKKVLTLVIVLVIAAFIVLALNSIVQKRGYVPDRVAQSQKLLTKGLPSGFPQDFPVDVTASLNQNGEQKDAKGNILLQFASNLTVSQAYIVYNDYFKNKGWTIISKIDQPVIKSLTAKSPVGDVLTVGLSPAPNQKTYVNASLVKGK